MGQGRTRPVTLKVSGPLSWTGMPYSLETKPGPGGHGKLLNLNTARDVKATTTGKNRLLYFPTKTSRQFSQ